MAITVWCDLMYSQIITICWSIRQVNRNLSDRKSLSDYSIKYLRDACLKLGDMLTQVDQVNPGEEIKVTDHDGKVRAFSLKEVAKMLSDAKKIREFQLIDHVDKWASAKAEG